ncbi:MAG TPA: amidohydrolase family protein [Mycobacteriales bacterium]|nr:amidohydrolase family protein [Mycobacteriales bacterium]
MLDLLIRGGTVVDGTGTPGRVADVGVRDGRIVSIGASDEGATKTIDATGLVVAPGFVDIHTHYDAQLAWDPTASPSVQHGVTTVIGGNCGFTLAPAGPEHADYLTRLLARVEGMPLEALQQGLKWNWSSYGEWLATLDGNIAVNAGFLVGHSALRRVAMGDAAVGEQADDAQLSKMLMYLHDALDAGALGFSTSQSPTHNDGGGDPVPSRHASDAELVALARATGEHEGTTLEAIVPGCLSGFSEDEVKLLTAMSTAADRPINWNVLAVSALMRDQVASQLAVSDRIAADGGRLVALTMPHSMKVRLSFLTGFVLDGFPGWRETMHLPVPERIKALKDPEVRRRLDEGARSPEAGLIGALSNWHRLKIVETFAPENADAEGKTVAQVMKERGAGHESSFDVLLDIVIADELRTGISPDMPGETAEDWAARAEVWRHPHAVVGASDAGAHLDMMCGAIYSTSLLAHAVREHAVVSIEEAVRLLTDVPARLYGLVDRGRIVEGAHADLVLFDPATVAPGVERTRYDLPGGAPRLYADAAGISSVIVGGVEVCQDGTATGALPGTLLRSGRDTTTVSAARVQ